MTTKRLDAIRARVKIGKTLQLGASLETLVHIDVPDLLAEVGYAEELANECRALLSDLGGIRQTLGADARKRLASIEEILGERG